MDEDLSNLALRAYTSGPSRTARWTFTFYSNADERLRGGDAVAVARLHHRRAAAAASPQLIGGLLVSVRHKSGSVPDGILWSKWRLLQTWMG